MKFLIM